MNELGKTAIYFVAAAVMIGIAFYSIPPEQETTEVVVLGGELFPNFDDPLKAKKLTIIHPEGDMRISAETKVASEQNEFVLEQQDGRWVLASFGNYPVAGNKQLQQASTALVGLEVLKIASQLPEDHEQFGVVAPVAGESSVGKKGVGLEVRFDDANGKPLADLIIGKAVKDQEGNRFVRSASSDDVVVVEISPDLFTSKFSAWVDQDLLELNPLDIESITINEYDLKTSGEDSMNYIPHMKMEVGLVRPTGRQRDPSRPAEEQISFRVNELISYVQGTPQQQSLLNTEQLNGKALNELLQTLEAIPLDGVDRKPSSVGAALRIKSADEAFDNGQLDGETRESLQAHQFYVGQFNNKLRIYGFDDVMVETKAGVQVWMYFGGPAGVEETEDSVKVKRYLLLLARLNEEKFPKPELAAVPKEPNEGEDAEEFQIRKSEIEKQNGRLMDAYNESIAKAKGDVELLNARFADWYYIITEDTYDKLHLDEREVIVEKQGSQSIGYNVDAFRELESMGLKNPRPQRVPTAHGFPQF